MGSGVKFPVTVTPGRNGPTLTATADWSGLPTDVPVNTHRVVLAQSTTVGVSLSPLAMSDQLAASTPGRFGAAVVEGRGGSVEVVVVAGSEPFVMGVELGGAASVDAGACAGLCSAPPQPATSVATARIVTGDCHRLDPNRVIILMNPQVVDDAVEKSTEGGCHDQRNGATVVGLSTSRHGPRCADLPRSITAAGPAKWGTLSIGARLRQGRETTPPKRGR